MVAAGATAAAGGLAALGTAAVKTYADYEQLVGGVETLFGTGGKNLVEYAETVGKKQYEVYHEFNALMDAQNKVLENASIAYETAGLSANDYMETVTGIAAALKQSTGSEMEAALAADQAIIDMADNANKMGTSMEAIQNAYQGFAKGNYTMLDNLKLGYGGTATEMARLINDSGVLGDAMIDLGDKQNIGAALGEVGLAKMYEAIHVIQTELGITGTTADEAFSTITGSGNAMKAAWENLLVGVADDTQNFDVLVDNFVNSVAVFAQNIIPRVGTALQGALNLVIQLAPIIAQQLPGLIKSLAPQVLNAGLGIVTWLVEGIKTNVPVLLEKGYELLQNLVNGFVEAVPEQLPQMLDFVQQMGDSLAEKVPILIEKGFELVSRLAEGIVSAFPILVEKVPTIISTFANIINDNFPTILMKGAEIIWQLIKGLISAIPTIIANIPEIIAAIVDTFMAFQWLNLGKNIMDFFKNGIDGMKTSIAETAGNILENIKLKFQQLPEILMNFGKSAMHNLGAAISGLKSYIVNNVWKIVSSIESTLLTLPGKMLSIGGDIIRGLWNGIANNIEWLLGKVGQFASDVISKVKDVFKVQSPSKEFKYIGEMCVAGYDKGMEDFAEPSYMTRKIKSGLTAMQNAVDTGTYAGGSAEGGNLYQTINVNREVATADEMARAIRLEARWGLVRSVPVG
ncbi:MAG: hypothetical protein IKW30_03645 [Lachnospiraceae bacterium]|nr:hypothetical protein [Lachnospiraceae bacterium]